MANRAPTEIAGGYYDASGKWIKLTEKHVVNNRPNPKLLAPQILDLAQSAMKNRAEERDNHPNGERSMKACVEGFNALTGHELTEGQGWLFMAVLKIARSQGGKVNLDDYVDGAAYFALAGEAVSGPSKDAELQRAFGFEAPPAYEEIVLSEESDD